MIEMSEIVKDYRSKKGWTQEQLAFLLGIDQTMVSKLENGENEPGKKLALKLAMLTEQPVEIFIR